MRTTCPRIVVSCLTAIIVLGGARAKAEEPPPEVDAARRSEQYVIRPGAEALLGQMLGQGETLPGGCTLSDGNIQRTAILATYTCGAAEVVLRLVHPSNASFGAVHTQRFAISVESGSAPAGLVDAVAERLRTREAAFEWTQMSTPSASRARWPFAVGAVVVVLALWALRRRTAGRPRSD